MADIETFEAGAELTSGELVFMGTDGKVYPVKSRTRPFRKKPVVIQAVQFTPQEDGKFSIPEGVVLWGKDDARPRDMSWGYIETLEGKMHVNALDWIVTGVNGERYPVKPDIFDKTYEAI